MQAQKPKHPEVFLFINSGSGGGVGKDLIAKNVSQLIFEVPQSQLPKDKGNLIRVTINLYNMSDQNNRKNGFQKLKNDVDQGHKVILVICGGDGTVMWVVSEMSNFQIDHLKVPLAMIPLGTGNDFSRVLGWGKQSPDILDNDYAKLKKRVTYWLSAQEELLDIWMIQAETQPYGKLEKVQNEKPTVLQTNSMKKHFCNYFSIGVDGKIGFSFDMHRTSTRMGNLAMYGVLGLAKSFTKTKSLEQLTLQFKQLQPVQIAQSDVKLNVPNELNRESSVRESLILHHKAESMKEYKDNENLLVMNINSFMGGIQNIWDNAKLPDHLKENKFTSQNHSDGKVQIISFGGPWSLGCEKAFGGRSTKVYQGSGPFQFTFKKFPQNEKHRTYLQIDGQFIRFTHPKKLTIQRSNLSSTGQIKILRRVLLQVQKGCCGCS